MSNPKNANGRANTAQSWYTPEKPRRAFVPVIVAPSTMRRAEKLALNTKKIHSGIYRVGFSTVSVWRTSCTCAARRKNPAKPCVHQIAVYLRYQIQTWGKLGAWLKNQYLLEPARKPKHIATYTKIKGYTPPKMQPFEGGFYRISGSWADGRYEITDKNGKTWGAVYREDMHTLTPFYAE